MEKVAYYIPKIKIMSTEITQTLLEEIRKKRPNFVERALKSPLKNIELFCLICVGGSRKDVETCTSPSCPHYNLRLGKNPFRTSRELTQEQKQAATERMKKIARSRKS